MTTLEEAAATFVDKYDKATTRRAYNIDLRHLQRYISPDVPVSSITPYDMQRALNCLRNRDSVNSVYTVNKFVKTMRTFFNWCARVELIESTPADAIQYLPTPDSDVLERTMPEDHYRQMVRYYTHLAAAKPERYQRALALLLVMGDSGARRSGLAKMRWKDVNYDEKFIWSREKGIAGKSDVRHKRYFGDYTRGVLRQWQIVQKLNDDINARAAYIFSRHGESYTPSALAAYFRRRCKECLGDDNGYGPHAVRHLVGFRLQDAKVPDNLAAAVMGHSVDTYRDHYAVVDDERIQQAANEVAYTPSPRIEKELNLSQKLVQSNGT